MRPLDYPGLDAVAAVAAEGSFERAAALLHITASAVSHRVKSLEERLGSALIVRGSPCRATEAGERLCRHLERVRLLETDLHDSLPGLWAEPGRSQRPCVRVVVNADSLATWCIEGLAAYASRCAPLLELSTDDQDFTRAWLAEGRVDCAITADSSPAPGCAVHPLGSLRYRATASPGFVARHGLDTLDREAFARAPCLAYDRKDALQRRWLRTALGEPVYPPAHRVPSSEAFVDATLLGMGWGMNPERLVAPHLESGRLVELAPRYPIDTPLYWQINRLSADLLRELTACVLRRAHEVLI